MSKELQEDVLKTQGVQKSKTFLITISTTKRNWETPPCLRLGHNLQSKRIAEKVVFPINACIWQSR